ncbi:hypothetical protein GX917_01185 [Candidatus Falkowbacteria bacterium]|jgi:hypothetical protein|nr:hypothetical protein [Candidatus Falkowbacteria bacterium]
MLKFQHNFLTYSGKIIVSLVLELIYFPIWWYSVGFLRFFKNIRLFLIQREKSLGFLIWAKNILVPMYGQYDLAGRVISFFMRLVQIIARGFILLLWASLCFLALLLWLILPVALVYALLLQILK